MAIYVKSKFTAHVVLSISVSKQLELLALNVEVYKGMTVTVVGCYRPPSAAADTLLTLSQLLSQLQYSEIVLAGDMNWDWLKPASDGMKGLCSEFNLTQLIASPTRPNPKHPEKSTLIDLLLTNAPHKFSKLGVFANDISDHCTIAAVRNAKIPKSRPRCIEKRDMKHFSLQGFSHDLFYINWDSIRLIDDVEIAWKYFHDGFLQLINKHAPMRKFRVKG